MGSERRRRRARGVGHRGMSAAASNLRRGLFKLVGRSRRLREQRFLESRIVTLADHRLGGPRPLTRAVQTWTTRFKSRSLGGSPWPRSEGPQLLLRWLGRIHAASVTGRARHRHINHVGAALVLPKKDCKGQSGCRQISLYGIRINLLWNPYKPICWGRASRAAGGAATP